MKALVLAAGKGTRIRHLTEACPKPMLSVAGKPLLEHLVGWLRSFGICDIAMNLHYLPEAITGHFGDGAQYDMAITYSYEPVLLGTAGAARRLSFFLDERFVVVYGDVFTNLDLLRLLNWHQNQVQNQGAVLTLALYRVPNPSDCGLVELNHQGRVVRFVEKPPPNQVFTNLASTGILVCEPEVLDLVPANASYDFGHDLLPQLLATGLPVYGMELGQDEFVVDIGTPAGYERAQNKLALTTAAIL